MKDAILNLNYLAVLIVAIAGFLVGWLWFSPVLFAKTWMAEMKITPEKMKAAAEKGMAGFFIRGFIFALLGTFGLAVLIEAHGSANWQSGALFGAFVGTFGPAVRILNTAVWEERSAKLQAINAGHEIVLYAVQGAILGMWR